MRALLILAAAIAVATPALAGQPVSLRADTVDTDGVVTLGDLFDGAGAASGVVLTRHSGASVMLDAAQVQAVARRAGLDWDNPEGLRKIVVRAEAGAGGARGESAQAARGNVDVLTYARSLTAGDVVQATDLVWSKAAVAPNDALSDPDAVIGMAAKRPLRAGAAVAAHDVGAAVVVKAGDVITVNYEADGVSLTLQGKAITSGGLRETISVLNTVSKKIIQAVVSGPGEAVVGPAADQMKAARSTRYAAR